MVSNTAEPGVARRVGGHIKAARVASGFSRAHVARSSGLTNRELAGYEQGKTLPSRRDARALAGACGVNLDELLPSDLVEALT